MPFIMGNYVEQSEFPLLSQPFILYFLFFCPLFMAQDAGQEQNRIIQKCYQHTALNCRQRKMPSDEDQFWLQWCLATHFFLTVCLPIRGITARDLLLTLVPISSLKLLAQHCIFFICFYSLQEETKYAFPYGELFFSRRAPFSNLFRYVVGSSYLIRY